ncbi:elongator acetyltransferase complex subunit 4, partial [Homo sapiens]
NDSGPRLVSIAGTRPSVRNGQLLVSTGLPALDQLLGGGLAVGTVLLIEEDKYNIYSPLLFKYFLAEGIVNGHTLLVASAKEDPANILQIKKELFLVSLLIRNFQHHYLMINVKRNLMKMYTIIKHQNLILR